MFVIKLKSNETDINKYTDEKKFQSLTSATRYQN